MEPTCLSTIREKDRNDFVYRSDEKTAKSKGYREMHVDSNL